MGLLYNAGGKVSRIGRQKINCKKEEKEMRILVIDDMPMQREHAVNVLSRHEVVTADGWGNGKNAIEKGNWDMVLTDLSMPGDWEGLSTEATKYAFQPTPYGFPLALLALKVGVPRVAIVSNGQGDDGNHHNHPIFWASDCLYGQIIPGRLWAFTGYKCPHMTKESLPEVEKPHLIKDWVAVVEMISDWAVAEENALKRLPKE